MKVIPKIFILSDRSALAHAAAEQFTSLARHCIETHGRFSVALSGGSTPRDLYTLLATPEFAAQVDWARVHVFWGDERAVPPEHPDSNFKMAHNAFLAHVPVPAQNIHRIHAELPPDDAARMYETELRVFFNLDMSLQAEQSILPPGLEIASSQQSLLAMTGTNPRSSALVRVPLFDLILLGLGSNGHTASLFPHTRVLHETQHWVAAEYIDEVKMYRITLTVPVLNAAANILWLVAGADKANTVRAVLDGPYRPDELPAQLIQPTNAQAVWLLDREASAQLSTTDPSE